MAGQARFQNWQQLRDHAIERFNGETPNPVTEQEVIDAYELHPAAIEKTIEAVAAQLQAGSIRSGWAITLIRARAIAEPPSNPDRPQGNEHEKMLARAEQRIRTIGPAFNRETEMLDDLFGDQGMFKDHPPDDLLKRRLVALWRDRRTIGIQLETELASRARDWNAHHTCPRCRKRFVDRCHVCAAAIARATERLAASPAKDDLPAKAEA